MIKVRKEKEGYIVSLYEVRKLNVIFCENVGAELRKMASEENVKIFFDLSRLRFIDSAGFSMLKQVDKIARQNGSELILCNTSEEIMELLKLPDFRDAFRISEDELSEERILVSVE